MEEHKIAKTNFEYHCALCGKDVDSKKALVFHHTDYLFNYGLWVCKACHMQIHHTEMYLEYQPVHKECKGCQSSQQRGCQYFDDRSAGCINSLKARMKAKARAQGLDT